MTTVKLNKFVTSNHLNEIFQSVDVKFAFVAEKDGVFTQIHQEGKCRDYLGDIPWSKHTGKKVEIYGMKYNYNDAPYDEDALKLSVTFPNEDTKQNFIKNIGGIFSEKEARAGIEKSAVILETDHKETLIVVADPVWMCSPWRLSLFTYYMKTACYENPLVLAEPERGYKKYLTDKAEDILLKNVKTAPVLFNEDLVRNHNVSGFISVIIGCYGENLDYPILFGGKS